MDAVLLFGGGALLLVGYVWLLIGCFSESVLWGIGGLLCGFVALAYGVMNFAEYKVPTILYVSGLGLHLIGRAI